MATTTTKFEFKIKDYKAEIHNDWCPGCGDFGILTALQTALANNYDLRIAWRRMASRRAVGQ